MERKILRPWKWKGGREAAQKRYREKNKEKRNAQNRKHYKKNRKSILKKHKEYRKNNKEKIYEVNAKWQSRKRAEYRKKVISGYGHKCLCCGESEMLFLEIHHPKMDGKQDRAKRGGNTYTLYKWLIEQKFPKGYDLLCANCHRAIHQSKDGICPHKKNQ